MSFRKIFIVRRVPGTGKTTLAKSNAKKYNTISHVQFTKKDVERHPVVADVLQIYDET